MRAPFVVRTLFYVNRARLPMIEWLPFLQITIYSRRPILILLILPFFVFLFHAAQIEFRLAFSALMKRE